MDERLVEERRKAAKDRAELEALRAQEAWRIVRKFQRARKQRMREASAKKNGLGGPRPPVAELDDPRPHDEGDLRPPVAELDESWPEKDNRQLATKYPARVTVLVLMEPRNRGWRRSKKAAYPVLCVGRRCYISAGAVNTANALSRLRVLGPVNSLGRRAGPCNNQLACVFRGVTLDRNPSHIQPVDMGLLRHKRRDIRKAAPDRTCAVTRGSLHCTSVIIAHRYRAWIVPEAVAEEAGPKALQDALHNGLTTLRSARLVSGRAP
jgi:colicin import membrane protein